MLDNNKTVDNNCLKNMDTSSIFFDDDTSGNLDNEESIPEDPELPEGDYFTVELEKAPPPLLIGIGIRSRKTDQLICINDIKENSPAEGHPEIQIGDIIVSVNETWTIGMNKTTLKNLVRLTKVGSKISLRLCRPKLSSPIVGAETTDPIDEDQDHPHLQARGSRRKYGTSAVFSQPQTLFPAITQAEKEQYFQDIETAVRTGDPQEILAVMGRRFEHSASLIKEAPCEPLHLALSLNLDEMAQCLLGLGVLDINNYSETFSGTPLILAASTGNFCMTELLVDLKAKQESLSSERTSLNESMKQGHDSISKILAAHHPEIDLRTDCDTQGRRQLLTLALIYGRDSLFKFWWSNKIILQPAEDENWNFLTAALAEIQNSKSEEHKRSCRNIVKFLLSKGAVIDRSVAENWPNEILDYLVQKCFHPDTPKFPRSVKWIDKRIAWINFDSWFKPVFDKVVELNLSINLLTEIPPGIPWSLCSLERFTLCHCEHLERLSSSESLTCHRLTRMIITDNRLLREIPAGWFDLPSLTHANFSNNSIEVIRDYAEEWGCILLDTLNLRNNKLKELPKGVSGAKHLKQLLLAENQLENLPPAWNCLLEQLDVSHNSLTCLPDGIKGSWGRTLQYVDASYNKLHSVPPELASMQRLLRLNLGNNLIRSLITPDLWNCSKLQSLNLSCNQLGSLSARSNSTFTSWLRKRSPTVTSGMPNFETPQTGRTENRPGSVLGFRESPSLNQLSLSSCSSGTGDDDAFPSVFSGKLTSLNLSSNQLQKIPKDISRLTELADLDISHNPGIHDIPVQFAKLQNLDVIRLEGLDLRTLPSSLNPRKKQSSVRANELVQYLRSQLRREENYRAVKIIVLGKERSGKSNVMSKLCDSKDLSLSGCIRSTTLTLVPPSDKKRSPIKFYIWELSGPETFYPVHQCFMTDKAVYLLVFRLDAAEYFDVSSWLLTIKARAPRAAVIVVGTHLDLLKNSNPTNWQAAIDRMKKTIDDSASAIPGCPRILAFIELQNDTYNMDNLKSTVFNWADNFVSKLQVPRSYIRLQETLEDKAKTSEKEKSFPVLTESDLWSIVQTSPDNDIENGDGEELAKVVALFHQTGILTSYSESIKAGVESWYYLDPSWLADLMLKLTVSKVSKRKLLVSEAMEILRSGSESLQSVDFSPLLAVMQKFELLILLTETQYFLSRIAAFLRKLPIEGPEIEMVHEGSAVCRVYKMTCTAPPGFWSRLIGRLLTRFTAPTGKSETNHPGLSCKTLQRQSTVHQHGTVTLVNIFTQRAKHSIEQIFYWAEGLFLQTLKGCLKVESLNQSKLSSSFHSKGLVITWLWRQKPTAISSDDFLYFGLAVDEVDLLISEWFPDFDYGEERIHRHAMCPVCFEIAFPSTHQITTETIQSGGTVMLFPVEALASFALQDESVYCPLHEDEEIPLSALIPDLFLKDLGGLRYFLKNDLTLDTMIAKGGQGAIFRGRLAQNEVAVKVFYADKKVLTVPSELSRISPRQSSDTITFLTARFCPTVTLESVLRNNNLFDHRTSQIPGDNQDALRLSHSQLSLSEQELPILFGFQRMRREVSFLSALSHPCIIKILGVSILPHEPLCFALDFAPLGNLWEYLFRASTEIRKTLQVPAPMASIRPPPSSLTEDSVGTFYGCVIDRTLLYKFAWQTAIALEYLHSQNILYRDLKAENVLVWSTDPRSNTVNIKLSDLGISCYGAPQGSLGTEGTRGYQAPEILRNMAYDETADMFAYGMLLFEILSGQPPFPDLSFGEDISRAVKKGRRPVLKESHVRPDFGSMIELMERCWSGNPRDRPTAPCVRKQMETLSFVALRQVLEMEPIEWEARQRGFAIVPPSSKNFLNTTSQFCVATEDEIKTDTKFFFLAPVDVKVPYVYISNGEGKSTNISIIDSDKCCYVEKDIPKKTTCTIACTSQDLVLLLSDAKAAKQDVQYPPSVEVFRFESGTFPTYVTQFPLEVGENRTVTSVCAIHLEEGLSDSLYFFAGLSNGEVAVCHSQSSLLNFSPAWTWTFASETRPVQKIVELNLDATILSACGSSIYLLDYRRELVKAVMAVFENSDITDLSVKGSGEFWCSDGSAVLKGYSLLAGKSSPKPNFLEVDFGGQYYRNTELTVSSMLTVDDTLWVALSSGKICIFDFNSGEKIGKLLLPVDQNFPNSKVVSMQVSRKNVVCLVEYSKYLGNAPPRIRHYSPDGTTQSMDKMQKIVVWKKLCKNQIFNYENMWYRMVELENSHV